MYIFRSEDRIKEILNKFGRKMVSLQYEYADDI